MAERNKLDPKDLEGVSGGYSYGFSYTGYAKRATTDSWEKSTVDYTNLQDAIAAAFGIAATLKSQYPNDEIVYWVDQYEGAATFICTAYGPFSYATNVI